jgi:hypothetical protein
VEAGNSVRFEDREWAIESANGLVYLLARQLLSAGETVFDVSPVSASPVRVLGSGRSQRNDANDARSVAIATLRSDRLALVGEDCHSRILRSLTSLARLAVRTGRSKDIEIIVLATNSPCRRERSD